MHRSRVCSIIIDCDDLEAGLAFWTRALGVEAWDLDGPDDPYGVLKENVGGLHVELQRVPERKTAKNRVHLDIETDDVEAEVRRLEALGARRQQQVKRWWVMEDPCGNEFCVIPAASPEFPRQARTWEGR